MSKKIQLTLSTEVWQMVEQVMKEASEGFHVGSITYSDVINEMILSSKLDIKQLQTKKTDIRRSLKMMAGLKQMDIDTAIRALTELKAKAGRAGKTKQTEGD